MMLAVGNVQGGVGKTILARSIAMARAGEGRAVLLVDGDEQETAPLCTEQRTAPLGTPGSTAVRVQGTALRTRVRQLAPTYVE